MSNRKAGELVELIGHVFAAGEAMDLDRFVQRFSEDALYQIGNAPAIRGRQAMLDAESFKAFNSTVKSLVHNVTNTWEVGDILIVEMTVTYVRRRDSKSITLPACDTVLFKGDMVQEMRIYMDLSPLFED